MVEKVLQKIGGNSGYGTFTVIDKGDASVDVRLAMAVPATATATATLTPAQILNGLLIGTPAAAVNYTLPLAATLDAAVKMDIGEAFDFALINASTVAANDITIVTNTGWTFSISAASAIVDADDETAGAYPRAIFRVRKTAAAAFTIWRIA